MNAGSHRFRIRVIYPRARGGLTLRTDLDWDRDVSPDSADEVGADFNIETDRPFLYLKPLLARDGARLWAAGENQLVVPGAGQRELYPRFGTDTRCSVCELQEIPDDANGESMKVRVHLPAGYDENTSRRYPVLYMQDGQNLFFEDEAFQGQTWGVPETLADLDAMSLVDPPLVVGIQPRDRMVQYTNPGYETYGRFLVDTLKPFIDRTYRTLPGPQQTAVMGSSLGGVVSFYLAWQYPDVFGQAACLSSTFGYQDDLMQRVASEPRRPIRLYLDSGWPRDNYEVTRAMVSLLRECGFCIGLDLLYLAFPFATHHESAWRMRSHQPFQFLFGPSVAGLHNAGDRPETPPAAPHPRMR